MKSSRWKAVLISAGFAVFAAALLVSCGKKEETEKMSVVLTVAETFEESTGSGNETAASVPSQRVDVVNGFRFEPCDEMVYCTGDGVKIRKKPGMDGEVIGSMNRGKYIHRVGKNSKWSRILWNGKKVYAASDYLSPYPPETEASETESAEEGYGETEAKETESPGEERNEDR